VSDPQESANKGKRKQLCLYNKTVDSFTAAAVPLLSVCLCFQAVLTTALALDVKVP
jgi:anthranilate/para-aminobenzoate synthase component II